MQEATDVRELDLALLFADLSGYTALTEIHGALTASGIVLQFCELAQASLDPGVKFINSIGDDVFCAGDSTLAVVRSALKLRDAAEKEPYFPRIRMGIHRGPIVERAGRLFGAPINLTARLADQAQGGQILCSAPIAETVGVLAGIEARPAGERHFKNVARPVSVFELLRLAAARAPSVIDPVCRMQIEIGKAVVLIKHEGNVYRFCSRDCAEAFHKSPELYVVTLPVGS